MRTEDLILIAIAFIGLIIGLGLIRYLIRLFFCSQVKIIQIGKLNMASNRNMDSNTNYVLLKTYAGASKNELKRNKSKNIEEAIDLVVKSTPGGEFLKNIKVFELYKRGQKVEEKYFAVEGDVWGLDDPKFQMQQGFRVGDKVVFKDLIGKKRFGFIKNLKNEETCMVQLEDNGKPVELSYDNLNKI